MDNRFYRVQDINEIKFYQVPKILFTNPRYKELSIGAKMLYALLRDRQDLSAANQWCDEKGYVYSIYGNDSLAELINVDRRTVSKYKKELIDFRLLVERDNGNGLARWLYVLKPEDASEPPSNGGEKTTGAKNVPVQKMQGGPVQKLYPNDTKVNDTDFDDDDCAHAIIHIREKFKSFPGFTQALLDSILKRLPDAETINNMEAYLTESVERELARIAAKAEARAAAAQIAATKQRKRNVRPGGAKPKLSVAGGKNSTPLAEHELEEIRALARKIQEG